MGKQKWTPHTILMRIRDWAESHDGLPPFQTDWKPRGHPDYRPGEWPSWMTVLRHFGTWPAAIERSGVEPRPDAHHDWTREEIVGKFSEWAEAHDGKAPLPIDWKRKRGHPDSDSGKWPSRAAVLRHFETWEAACAEAGLQPRDPLPKGGHGPWPTEQIIERIQAWARAHDGHGPAPAEWARQGSPDWEPGVWPSSETVRSRFDSWEQAMEAAGVAPHRDPLPEWDRDQILQRIRDWTEAHDGTPPIRADWHVGGSNPAWNAGEWPHATTVVTYFETWENALAAAGVIDGNAGREPG